MRGRSCRRRAVQVVGCAFVAVGCTTHGNQKRIEPVYDRTTGRLILLKYDSKGTGKVDTWSHMDGPRVLRIDLDTDGDGRVDRWEYYRPDRTLEKIGISRARDGREDAWYYAGSDGSIARIELWNRQSARVNRIEYYERNRLVRAEEDSDGDGRPDKWETYEDGRLASTAFDTARRGWPDRRLVYVASGAARLEMLGRPHEAPALPRSTPLPLAAAPSR